MSNQPEGQPEPTVVPRSWREVWQVPALVLGVAVLLGAVAMAVMTTPKTPVEKHLEHAAALLEARRYGESLEYLNTAVLPHLAGTAYSPDDRRTFHLLRARALYRGQKDLGIERTENYASIRGEYESAERLNASLGPDDLVMFTESLMALDDLDAAANRAELLPESHRDRRLDLFKRMITRSMHGTRANHARALDLVTVLAADANLSNEDRAWTLVRQAELMIASGFADDAITRIIRTLPRLGETAPSYEGEVRLTLAKAYLATGAIADAKAQLVAAAAKLPVGHELHPLITLLRAEIDQQNGELQAARERYLAVLEATGFEQGHSSALLGLAEVESQIAGGVSTDEVDQAQERYSQLVDLMRLGTSTMPTARVSASLLTRFHERFERKDFVGALRFAKLAERLHGSAGAPAEVLLALAEAHRRLAEELLTSAAAGGALSLAQADPATQREAREHLLRGGEYFRLHGAKVVREDSAAYADSVWNSADMFDRAGELDASIQAFQQFIGDIPGDTRRPEAAYRLGQAYLARGDVELAAKVYQALIESRGGAEGSGAWGDRSAVPLAKALLDDADPANDARAEAILMQAAEGEYGGPGTANFRAAIKELGEHQFRTGRYESAVERFEQYLALADREGGESARVLAGVRFRLADAYRRSASEMAKTLAAGLPDGTRRALQEERRVRLRRAAGLYEAARVEFDAVPRRTMLEELSLRNAFFYKGDCAFDLGEFDDALRCYEAARERYAREPAALVAMTQMVSVLLAQGKAAQAADANARAKRFYESLPEQVWDDPTLPMSRADWERWLAAQDRLAGAAERDVP
ncbi:MAG: hypothetical protein HBSAPP03_00700 [Phycisphaerae bacterium]|nr:MAG: hypothetical protein HBSAPP03_00700 [Phycisphaerae bacterium]